MKNSISKLALSLLVLSALGCARYDAAHEAEMQAEADASRAAEEARAARSESAEAVGDSTPVPTGPPVFTAQSGWVEQPPSNAMRMKEYRLGEGDTAPVVVVSHWPNGIGPVDENIDRWVGMIDVGSDDDAPVTEASQRDGLRISTVDGTGKMALGMSGGAEPGRRMLAAFVDAPGGRFDGAYTIKVVADTAALEPWVESFHAFLAGL